MTAQVYNVDGEYHLCHSSCELLDAGTLENWLSEIKTWMDANTNDGTRSPPLFPPNSQLTPPFSCNGPPRKLRQPLRRRPRYLLHILRHLILRLHTFFHHHTNLSIILAYPSISHHRKYPSYNLHRLSLLHLHLGPLPPRRIQLHIRKQLRRHLPLELYLYTRPPLKHRRGHQHRHQRWVPAVYEPLP